VAPFVRGSHAGLTVDVPVALFTKGRTPLSGPRLVE
jgi:hypothetical protein